MMNNEKKNVKKEHMEEIATLPTDDGGLKLVMPPKNILRGKSVKNEALHHVFGFIALFVFLMKPDNSPFCNIIAVCLFFLAFAPYLYFTFATKANEDMIQLFDICKFKEIKSAELLTQPYPSERSEKEKMHVLCVKYVDDDGTMSAYFLKGRVLKHENSDDEIKTLEIEPKTLKFTLYSPAEEKSCEPEKNNE